MQVVLHAGAAFTDDGRVLASLQANLAARPDHSAFLFGPRRYRQILKPALDRLDTDPQPPGEVLKNGPPIPYGLTEGRLILSAPDLIGEASTAIMDGQFYPLAGKRLAYINEVFNDDQLQVCIGLLHPGYFISKILTPLTVEQRWAVVNSTDLSCLSWLGMVEDIRDLVPDAQLTLWCNEDTPFIWGDVLRTLIGMPKAEPLQDEYDLLESLLTEDGKSALSNLLETDEEQEVRVTPEDLASVLERYADPEKIEEDLELPGWTDEIFSAFSELYEQDIAKIQSMTDVQFLSP